MRTCCPASCGCSGEVNLMCRPVLCSVLVLVTATVHSPRRRQQQQQQLLMRCSSRTAASATGLSMCSRQTSLLVMQAQGPRWRVFRPSANVLQLTAICSKCSQRGQRQAVGADMTQSSMRQALVDRVLCLRPQLPASSGHSGSERRWPDQPQHFDSFGRRHHRLENYTQQKACAIVRVDGRIHSLQADHCSDGCAGCMDDSCCGPSDPNLD